MLSQRGNFNKADTCKDEFVEVAPELAWDALIYDVSRILDLGICRDKEDSGQSLTVVGKALWYPTRKFLDFYLSFRINLETLAIFGANFTIKNKYTWCHK